MKKLKLIATIIFIVILSLYFCHYKTNFNNSLLEENQKSSNNLNSKKTHTNINADSSLETLYEEKIKPDNQESNYIFVQEDREILDSSKEKVVEQTKKSEDENVFKTEENVFKTADDVIDVLFSDIKSEFGSEMVIFLKTKFPFHYLLDIMTPEQREKYREILDNRREDIAIVTKIYDGRPLTIEEGRAKRRDMAPIQEFYMPQIINILTKEQQYKLAENMKNDYFDMFRDRKEKGLPLIEDALDNLEKMMKDPELLKKFEEKRKEIEGQ